MPATSRSWTREEVLALPDDGNRYELVDGELLVSPSPRAVHQDAVALLHEWIVGYVRARAVGHVSMAPADLELRTGEIYQPDLFVVPLISGRKPLDWREYLTPLVVAEVGSPSTARYDRVVKRPAYQDAGVAEYWIIDLDARLVERWRPVDQRPEIIVEQLIWAPAAAIEPWRLDLPSYFAEVWGEVSPK